MVPLGGWTASSGIGPGQAHCVELQGRGARACKIGAVKPAYRKVNPRLPVPIDLGDERITFAVGTTIADGPPRAVSRQV